MYQQETVLSSQHHDDTCMGKEEDHKPEIIMRYKVESTFWASL